MANRPLFIPLAGSDVGVREIAIEFQWFPGMAKICQSYAEREMPRDGAAETFRHHLV